MQWRNVKVMGAEVRSALIQVSISVALFVLGFVILCVVVAYDWWNLRTQAGQLAATLFGDFPLPPGIRVAVSSIVYAPTDALAVEMLVSSTHALVRVWLFLIGSFAISTSLKLAISQVSAERQYVDAVYAELRIDKRVMHRWFPRAALCFIAAVLVAAFSRQFNFSLVLQAVLIVGGCVLMLLVTLLRHTAQYVNSVPEAKQVFLLAVNSRYRRIRVYANGLGWLLVAWLTVDFLIPWALNTFKNFPDAYYRRSEILVAAKKPEEVRQRMLAALRSEVARSRTEEHGAAQRTDLIDRASAAFDHALTLGGGLRKHLKSTVAADTEELRKALEPLGRFIGILFVTILLFVAMWPWLVTTYAQGGWRGFHKGVPRLWPTVTVIAPVIPVAYFADKLGLTADRPIIWFIAACFIGLTDSFLSSTTFVTGQRVFFVLGGMKYHLERDCRALKQTPDARRRETHEHDVAALGLEACGLCGTEKRDKSVIDTIA